MFLAKEGSKGMDNITLRKLYVCRCIFHFLSIKTCSLMYWIGNLVQTSSDDWSIVLDICEQVSHSESAAKDASRGLRKLFKYGQASPQLAAARLWAVILRNMNAPDPHSQPMFLRETSGRKFMDVVEDVATNPKTEPVVRERLLEVLGGAVFDHTGGDRKHPYAVLWRKLKAKGQPEKVSKLCRFCGLTQED
jgi:hypothetical protein